MFIWHLYLRHIEPYSDVISMWYIQVPDHTLPWGCACSFTEFYMILSSLLKPHWRLAGHFRMQHYGHALYFTAIYHYYRCNTVVGFVHVLKSLVFLFSGDESEHVDHVRDLTGGGAAAVCHCKYPSIHPSIHSSKHQCSAPLAFVRGIHQWPVVLLTKGQ